MCRRSSLMDLEEAVIHCLKSFVPFYLYRREEASGGDLCFGASLGGKVETFDGKLNGDRGFVVSPFESSGGIYFIPGEWQWRNGFSDGERDELLQTAFSGCHLMMPEEREADTMLYHTAFEEIMQRIRRGELSKVVLSRFLSIRQDMDGFPDVFTWWNRLREVYPHAFVFLYFIPERGLWMGASPELLLDYREGYVRTMALAGTRCLSKEGVPDASWLPKEMEEQGIVKDAIREILEVYCKDIEISEDYTYMAGNVCHLRTDFKALLSGDVGCLLKALHPTPALGGFPRDKALECIREVERYDRRFYGGYLGPVGEGNAEFHVNIRSMELFTDGLRFYAGGGINGGSVFEDEWKETEDKVRTLLNVIKVEKHVV